MRRRHLPRAAATLALTLAVATGLTGLAACADEADTTTGGPGHGGEPTHGTMVEGDGWEGVLLYSPIDHVQLPDGTVVEDASSFIPTEADVRRFEDQVDTALPDAGNPSHGEDTPDDLDGYVRQYSGVEGGGVRHLVVAGICPSAAEDMDWDAGWIEVNDGGTCFWDAKMDLDTGEIHRLSFHGSA
jgi:hypothetical protein